jgi:hypothetical protein
MEMRDVMTTIDRIQKRYDLLEWLCYLADIDLNVSFDSFTDEVNPIYPPQLNTWLRDLASTHSIDNLKISDDDPAKPLYYRYTFRINKPTLTKKTKELYNWLQLSVDNLGIQNLTALLDLVYEMKQYLEVTLSDTITVGESSNTNKHPELNERRIPYRSNAINFMHEYGAVVDSKYDGFAMYDLTVDRLKFDLFYRRVMNRGRELGLVTQSVKNNISDPATQQVPTIQKQIKPNSEDEIADAPLVPKKDNSPSTKIELHKFEPIHYDKKKGILYLSPLAKVFIAKKGGVKRKSNGKKYAECKLLEKLFESVNSLDKGVKISKLLILNDSKVTKKDVAKVRNYISEINKKVQGVGGPKKLIYEESKYIKIIKLHL